MFSLDQVVIEPLPWTGNMAQPHDKTSRGKYLFEIVDPESGVIVWSRSFSSIYGEWETTGESKQINRSFHESVRFPAQDSVFELVIKKRGPGNPTYSWVNGKWIGKDSRFDRAYWMQVVDDNKIIGREESCRLDNGACSGRVPLWGEITSKDVLEITYDKTNVPRVGRIFHQTLVRSGTDTLDGPGFELRRSK